MLRKDARVDDFISDLRTVNMKHEANKGNLGPKHHA